MADGGGLYLLIKPSGTRSWRLDYIDLGVLAAPLQASRIAT
ncbi:Arm DNA-binding domain-containing protein [Devosia sp.]